jgi:purine-nucleoside phosphorylase
VRGLNPQGPAKKLESLSRLRPSLAIVLGSGFQHVVNAMQVDAEIPFPRLPGFPRVGVTGHAGRVCIGKISGTPVMLLSGRAHYYEGHSMSVVTFAVRVLAAYGIRDLILTNAAGGLNKQFKAGDFMAITDHINLMGANPLFGVSVSEWPRFVDLTTVYDLKLRNIMSEAARLAKIRLRSGVYLAVSGPSYETPAEIRAFARLGADAVGMSTVPEAIVARQCGMNVAGLSCITNLAAGIAAGKLSHSEVLETGERVKELAAQLLKNLSKLYGSGN